MTVPVRAAPTKPTEEQASLVDDALDDLEIDSLVYHDLSFSRPLVDELCRRVTAATPAGGRILLVGPHAALALALQRRNYNLSIIRFGEAFFPDELESTVVAQLDENALVDGKIPLSGMFDTIVLPMTFEHMNESPEGFFRLVNEHLLRQSRVIVVLLHLSRFSTRFRMLLGRDVLPPPEGVNLQMPGGWPRAKLRRLYTAREIVDYGRRVGLHDQDVAFVEGLEEYLPPIPLNPLQYLLIKIKSGVKRTIPSLRDHAIVTFVRPDANEPLPALAPSPNAGDEDHPFVSVVLPTRDRVGLLPTALDALFAQDYPSDRFEIVVINDGSVDNTAAIIATYAAKAPCKFVAHTTGGIGAAAARNLGSRLASGSIIAHTDDDCRVPPGWLRAGVMGFERNVAFVCGPIYPDTRDRWSFFTFVMWQPNDNGTYPTSNIFYRRDAFLQEGQFDERFGGNMFGRPMWGWDSDMAWRLLRRGYARQFREDAWCYSHIFPVTKKRWLLEGWRAVMLPGVVRQVPELRRTLLRWRVFLSPDTALYELGVVGTVIGLAFRKPALLLLWGPWLQRSLSRARGDWFPPLRWIKLAVKLAFMFVQAAVFLAGVVRGSVRARRLVL